MTELSMFQVSVPAFERILNNMIHILRLAIQDAVDKRYDPNVLLGLRFAPDMFPLLKQVQIVSDNAKECVARLAGVEPPTYANDEQTVDELVERLQKTLAYVQTFKPEQINGSEQKAIVLKTPRGEWHFVGNEYLLKFVLPNVYFHVTTTYNLLRSNGVALGKMDYLGKI